MTIKTWTEPLVQRLARGNRVRDPRRAIEAYAHKLRTDAQQTKLPIDVELIASVKGIRKREGNYDFAGRIYVRENGQLVMDLNSNDNHARRRFTCAHELMHTAFPGFEEEGRYRLDTSVGTNSATREEELLCDLGAAELLMPTDLVAGRYGFTDGLKGVEHLADDADVSLEAAGNRIAEISTDPGIFMVFEFGYKPADQPALRRGEQVRKEMRLRYARGAHLGVYLPRFKGAGRNGAVARAHSTGELERRIELLPGARDAGRFLVEAKAYRFADRKRVLAVAQPER
jgi:Zn-dependent peptidase ImmA (M78 family)